MAEYKRKEEEAKKEEIKDLGTNKTKEEIQREKEEEKRKEL